MTVDRWHAARRLGALRRGLSQRPALGPWALAPTAGFAAGFAASFAVDAVIGAALDPPLRQLVAIGGFVVVAAPVWLAIEPRRMRAAREVATWLNGWEQERWQREAGRRLPGLPRATPEILDALPDTMGLRPLRVELLATLGRLDEARQRLAELPTETAWQRWERAALAEFVAFVAGEPELRDAHALEAGANELDAERRLVARGMLALGRARRLAVAGEDPSPPLADLRAELGRRPGRYGLSQVTGTVAVVTLIGIVAGIAVTAASAVVP